MAKQYYEFKDASTSKFWEIDVAGSKITIRYGKRLRALSVRFEGVDNRWLCTALNLL